MEIGKLRNYCLRCIYLGLNFFKLRFLYSDRKLDNILYVLMC